MHYAFVLLLTLSVIGCENKVRDSACKQVCDRAGGTYVIPQNVSNNFCCCFFPVPEIKIVIQEKTK